MQILLNTWRARRGEMKARCRGARVAPRRGSAMVSPTQCYKVGRHAVPWGRVTTRWGDTWHRRVGQRHSGATRGGTTMGHRGAGRQHGGVSRGGATAGRHKAGRRWVAPLQGNAGWRHNRVT
ncbi:hypothetical protein GUJ93_ZPchr0011g28774 [Zizania palustris]|uniref:Uncharacterized protein n=1 Tax=Zizania palustris TaxID=103762 RepID=A0A8J6BS15_ZIZPA|nr:hypothetical protein GUJ93_ZPchr0011g28774 [Zizania palustris]